MIEAIRHVKAAVERATDAPVTALRYRLLEVATAQHRVNVEQAREMEALRQRVAELENTLKGDR